MIRKLNAALCLFIAAFALGACVSAQPRTAINPDDYDAPVRLACVGDSITYGFGIKDRDHDSYPAQIGALLGEQWVAGNFGHSGATLLKNGDRPYWTVKEYQAALDFKPDVVVIKLGTNDTKPRNWAHKAEFLDDYAALIESFRALESHPKVWICKPVPAFPENWGITDKIISGEINPLIDEISEKTGAPVIDLHTALSGRGDLFPDRIHPNPEGAGIMADAIYETLTSKVSPKRGGGMLLKGPFMVNDKETSGVK